MEAVRREWDRVPPSLRQASVSQRMDDQPPVLVSLVVLDPARHVGIALSGRCRLLESRGIEAVQLEHPVLSSVPARSRSDIHGPQRDCFVA